MTELIEINAYPVKNVLSRLLLDKTTGKNIIFATDDYARYGCYDTDQITENALLGFDSLDIQPRVMKDRTEQSERTRKKAEVFTPTWIVKQMCDHCDSVWQDGKYADDWQKYVQLRILEIACGEAPFLVTRYDTTTGERLLISERTGMLDRKLQAIQADDEETWLKWAFKSYESTYGYEFQGDNLLIARINLLVTFCDYLEERWQRKATDSELKKIANIIAWNLWQMDGLKDTVPLGVPGEEFHQFSLFGDEEPVDLEADSCKIYNHRSSNSLLFADIKEGKSNMKFDFVIGNPPYQDNTLGDNETYAPPIYHLFMDAAFTASDKVELITPARFLFNAGSTLKSWNAERLTDNHFKILYFEQDSTKVFKNTVITGGLAISYRDANADYKAIKVFTQFSQLNSILHKAINEHNFQSLEPLVVSRTAYRLTEKMHEEHPEAIEQLSKGHAYDMSSNIFERLPQIFFDSKPDDGFSYVRIYGKVGTARLYKYVREDYVRPVSNLHKYKVLMARADGAAGTIGNPIPARIIGTPIVEVPNTGNTETFLSIGAFADNTCAENALKYIKTRFARTLLSVLKTTQDITPEKFKYVPLQDFTENSDIDWSKPVSEIDQQLYAKYGLTQEEIDFIETHVKEMD